MGFIAEKPLSVGRQAQVFVDDALIHRRHGIVRSVQPATKMDHPVMVPEHSWEFSYHPEDDGVGKRIYLYGTVFFDPLQARHRMWYMSRMSRRHDFAIPELEIPGGGNVHNDLTLYATSQDGIHWEKPNLDVVHFNGSGQNNIVGDFHGASVFLDPEEPDPQKRYKAIGFIRRFEAIMVCHSPDGIHWSAPRPADERRSEGSFNVCYVPRLGRYVAGSVERLGPEFVSFQGRRARKRANVVLLSEGADLTRWVHKTVLGADEEDDPGAQNYGMTPFVYGDVILAFYHVFHYKGPGPVNDDGSIEAQLAYSRDGRTWHRLEDRRPAIPVGPKGSFDGGMIMNTAVGTSVHGDELIAYYTAADNTHGALIKDRQITIGRSSWRRDRLVALEAREEPGTVVTQPFLLEGSRLDLNVDARGGWVQVELLDQAGAPIPGFSGQDAKQYEGVDELNLAPQWKSGGDLSSLKGTAVRLACWLEHAKLYAFAIGP
jgi:hypothetical protein